VIKAKDLELGKRRKLRLRMIFVKTNDFHSSPTPAPIQPNDYLANDEADPEEELEEGEEPIPE
ncbi:hypothetical protein Tco_0027775, partial [Tanacetum coccineum]